MIPSENALLLFKFGEYKWIKKIKNGDISFSCPGRYIDIAKKSGNTEQGDLDEAVFARLRKGDKRIRGVSETFKNDLEIIDDGHYVKLRRKSSKFVPTFCFYSYKGSDLLSYEKIKEGTQVIPHYFDDRVFSSFASSEHVINVLHNDFIFATLILHPEPFKFFLKEAMFNNNLSFTIRHINYSEFEKDEFFIDPTDRREELFYKFPRFKYQHETRICLNNV